MSLVTTLENVFDNGVDVNLGDSSLSSDDIINILYPERTSDGINTSSPIEIVPSIPEQEVEPAANQLPARDMRVVIGVIAVVGISLFLSRK